MKQLGGSDSVWFAVDTENTPMHVTQTMIYGPEAEDGRRMTPARLKRYVEQRIGSLPLRSKLITVPFKADYPYWIEDENFNLDDHISQMSLPAPANWATLLDTLRAIVERPLDHSRPLWELHLISGLGRMREFPAGSFAIVMKVHHGQFDGTNLRKFLFKLHSPLDQLQTGEGDAWVPDRHPSSLGLLTRASWNRYRWWWQAAAAVGKATPSVLSHMIKDGIENLSGSEPAKHSTKTARTRFLCNISSPERIFDALEFSLPEVLAMRKLVKGATVNDVALSISGGAVRKYLDSHGELPEAPVSVLSPVSAHEADDADDTGNRISAMFTTIYTDTADPLERLRLIHASSGRAKQASKAIGLDNIVDVIDTLPTNLLGAGFQLFLKFGLIDHLPLESSGISLTNVPASAEPMYLDGFRMLRTIGAGFLLDGLGLLLIATSYEKVFSLQFFTSPDIMPDPEHFRSCIEEAYAEMQQLL